MNRALYPGSLCDVAGLTVGHYSDERRPTGCSVVIAAEGAVASVAVRGGAPGTRETDLLAPTNLIAKVHAVLLSGGSAWGLDAASGVMQWLEEKGIGLQTDYGLVPIVPAAVVFDLGVGDGRIRPNAQAGYQACVQANSQASAQGNVGAGCGALVGKLFGLQHAMKGGIGSASICQDGVTVAALVVCNAMGDVIDPSTGQTVAGARSDDGRTLRHTVAAMLRGEPIKNPLAGTNTTIGVIATDAVLTKIQAQRLAQLGHDGLARSINPVHTLLDGDTLFALATGSSGKTCSALLLGTLAAEVTARAVFNAVVSARGIRVAEHRWPAAGELETV